MLTDNTWYRDSGFESWNYPASSVSSAASSIEQFECSKLNYNSTLMDKSQEERFKIDVEVSVGGYVLGNTSVFYPKLEGVFF